MKNNYINDLIKNIEFRLSGYYIPKTGLKEEIKNVLDVFKHLSQRGQFTDNTENNSILGLIRNIEFIIDDRNIDTISKIGLKECIKNELNRCKKEENNLNDTEEISTLLNSKWKDKYLNLLAISDHLTECKLKYEAYKLDSINKDFSKEELKFELDKELMDLKILLDIYVYNNSMKDLYNKRIERFLEKLK